MGESTTIHIGNNISRVLEEKQISVSELANQLHTDKSNMYKILRKSHLDTDLLYRISRILNYNFFLDYCQDERNYTSIDTTELLLIKVKSAQLSKLLSGHDDIEILFKGNG